MKRAFLLALVIAPLLVLGQQSETRDVGRFTGIKAGEAIDVYLKKGDKESVKVVVSKDELRNIITEVVGSSLRIHRKESGFFNSGTDARVYVTYVSLDRIYASSAANVFSDGPVKAARLEIQASSAADIEISVEADNVSLHASSAGDIILQGTSKSLTAEASSSGDIDAYEVKVESARASASSGGGIKLSVSGELEAKASSGGSVRYRGNPARTNTHASSGGSVKKSN